ncbi:MAG: chemotaxis response regulator protein-glutamate methylesterase [Deltaproteobacteria bacterium]|nr:chemotaxis response regulator protein-glutamate methylesterase [Deltaproteobacteria bacterium]
MSDTVTLKALIVDDSAMHRKIVQDVLETFPYVEVVGAAQNGKIALLKAASLKPDLLTLDIEMPEMDGLEVLERLRHELPEAVAIVFSAFTTEGARITLRALELGAFDFIPKPSAGKLEENRERFRSEIEPMLETLIRSKRIKPVAKEASVLLKKQIITDPGAMRLRRNSDKSRAIAIGISTGGPVALAKMIPSIPADVGVPIFIVQHMPPMFTDALAAKLDSMGNVSVKEAVDGEVIRANTVYIAPGGRQMKVGTLDSGSQLVIQVTDDPPENNCKPSADYLFRSIARHYGKYSTGVIMTGMGYDGTEGLKLMKQNGAMIIAQDESTSAVYGMPRKPVEIGIVDVIAPLDLMAEEICRTVRDRF